MQEEGDKIVLSETESEHEEIQIERRPARRDASATAFNEVFEVDGEESED